MNANSTRRIRIGTRGSRLALWQAEWVARAITQAHPQVRTELVRIHTLGDRDQATDLTGIAGEGVFVKEIQRALLEGQVDLAVHSMKDMPVGGPEALRIAAIPARESPFDALVAPGVRSLKELPQGARIGTGSPRRRAMLLAARPDLTVTSLRGNVETRLAAARDGRLDAVILAEAGLRRLGLIEHMSARLEPPSFLPAVGQGALGLECRAEDSALVELMRPLDDQATRLAVHAERAILETVGGGCSVPISAWSRLDDGLLRLDAAVFSPDGQTVLRESRFDRVSVLSDAERLGKLVAERLLAKGAGDFLVDPRRPA
jgi:hydroxymethylbilane synthase